MTTKTQYSLPYRIIGAAIGWTTLIVQYGLTLASDEHAGLLAATISYFSYFTLLTNLLVALAFTAPLLAPTKKLHIFFIKPAVRAAIALYILVVAVVYHSLLRQLWEPQGLQLATDIGLHSVMPALYLFDWVFFSAKRPMQYIHIPYWIIFPTIYGFFTILRGALTGIYPYPFLNVTELGFGSVLINMVAFMALYAAGSVTFIALGGFLSKPKTAKLR